MPHPLSLPPFMRAVPLHLSVQSGACLRFRPPHAIIVGGWATDVSVVLTEENRRGRFAVTIPHGAAVTGNGSGRVCLRGTVDQINAALADTDYIPPSLGAGDRMSSHLILVLDDGHNPIQGHSMMLSVAPAHAPPAEDEDLPSRSFHSIRQLASSLYRSRFGMGAKQAGDMGDIGLDGRIRRVLLTIMTTSSPEEQVKALDDFVVLLWRQRDAAPSGGHNKPSSRL